MSASKKYWQPNLLGIPKLDVPDTTYKGEVDELNLLDGDGQFKWSTDKWEHIYEGKFFHDCLHGYGNYRWDNKLDGTTVYDGTLYANNIEGYGCYSYPNGSYYEGLFKYNKRFGPGIFTNCDGKQDIGMWDCQKIMRLSGTLRSEWVPRLAKSPLGKARILQYRKLVPVNAETRDSAEDILLDLGADEKLLAKAESLYSSAVRNPNSNFFNKKMYDRQFFESDEAYCIDVALSEEELNEMVMNSSLDAKPPEEVSTDSGMMSNTTIPVRTKKVAVTDLIAWNNSDLSIAMLRHTFLHRNSEDRLLGKIQKLLSGDRAAFRIPGPHEQASIAFLLHCSDGIDKYLFDLVYKYNVHPDVCDAKGNSGIIFAASRDRHSVIRVLNNLGSQFNSLNDEGLTPLQIALLRYVATKNSVVNWEAAFLPPVPIHIPPKRIVVKEWNPHLSFTAGADGSPFYLLDICETSLISLVPDPVPLPVEHRKGNSDAVLAEYRSPSVQSQFTCDDGFIIPTGLMRPTLSQECYNKPNGDDIQPYIFYLEPKVPPKPKPKKNGKKICIVKQNIERANIPVDKSLDVRLNIITATVLLLLHKGASPTFGEVPFPPLIVAMFTQRPEIIDALLRHGADPNVRMPKEDGSLTPLHILMCFNPFPKMDLICRILLSYGADPNLRTSSEYWEHMKKSIGGLKYEDDGLGKTCLHILCIRPDMEEDIGGFLTKLAKLLLENKADPNLLYLGHSPLSIAIVKGNRYLVKELLETERVDPNQKLGAGYGVPLTLLLHENNLEALPFDQSIVMLNTLVEYGANPLNTVADIFNSVEYVNDRIADIQKHVPLEARPKRKGKSAKNDPEKIRKKLLAHLVELTSRTLVKDFEGRVLTKIYDLVHEPNAVEDLAALQPHAQILSFEKSVHIFKRQVDAEKKLREKKVMGVLEHVLDLEFAAFQDKRNRQRRSSLSAPQVAEEPEEPPPEYDLTTLSGYLCVPRLRRTPSLLVLHFPEADPDRKKYDVCFECHIRHGAFLIACPTCGLVKFCSELCNINNVKAKGVHKCEDIFYNRERARLEALMGIVRKKVKKKKKSKRDKSQDKDKGKKGEGEKQGQTAGKLLSQKYLEYMMQVSGSGYVLDLDRLFFPYCAYVDGNVYYRIFGSSPMFKENYSLV